MNLHFEHEASPDLADWAGYDLVIAADGANSRIRDRYEQHFGVDIQVRRNKFFWFGTSKVFEAFTFAFEETEAGWVWAHAYRFDDDLSTFIVEMDPETWAGLGLDRMDQREAIALCERIFAKYLDGHALMSNATHLPGPQAWLNFRRIVCDTWSLREPDPARRRRAHRPFLDRLGHQARARGRDQARRGAEPARPDPRGRARRISGRAQSRGAQAPEQRAQLDRMVRDARPLPPFRADPVRLFAAHPLAAGQPRESAAARQGMAGGRRALVPVEARGPSVNEPAPPMFAPFRLRALELVNRVVVSPMAMYSAQDGMPNDFHLVHYGARAQGGAGLVYTEMTCVSPEGRITPGCTGIYAPEHVEAWRRIVDFVHANSAAKFCLQLGHSGPKGSTKVGWEGYDVPLERGNWPVMAASDVPWSPDNQVPRPMTRALAPRGCGPARLGGSHGMARLPRHEWCACDVRRLRRVSRRPGAGSTDDRGQASRTEHGLDIQTPPHGAWSTAGGGPSTQTCEERDDEQDACGTHAFRQQASDPSH